MLRFRALTLATLLATAAQPALAQSERTAIGSAVSPSERANSAERPVGFASAIPGSGALAIPMAGADDLSNVPEALRDAVRSAIATAGFKAAPDKTLSLYSIGGYARVLLIGVPKGSLSAAALADFGGRAVQELRDTPAEIAILAGGFPGDAAAHVALGARLGQYRYDRLRSGVTAPPAQPVSVIAADPAAADALYKRELAGVADSVRLARDLITGPSNIKTPESFVEAVRAQFRGVAGVTITVLTEPQLRALNMGALLSVAQGSRRPARLLIVEYRGAGDAAPLALVGKGITFDSGGTSLKPAAGMQDMRGDMSGAAAAVAAVHAAARRGARANVIGVAALAENMPGGNASRPGDVVRTFNGQTIEIINTDAEGRLVLADANQYVIDRYRPAALVNIATLTGAIVTALGDDYAGLFARDDALARRVEAAAARSGEAVWRMPVHASYADDMASPIADIANSVSTPGAGAGRGAHFIGFLTPQPTPWAHIDMAGVDATDADLPTVPKGARGFGVRLFDALVREFEAR